MDKLLYVENLSVGYDGKYVVDDINFSLEKDSIQAILCPNNGGKSSIIKTLSGVIPHNCGKIYVNKIPLNKRNFKKYIKSIGVVFDDIEHQFLQKRVIDELRFPLVNLCYSKKDINLVVDKISNILLINNILNNDISSLSNYEKIKVLIATSIVNSPKILFLDDIFKYLSKKEKTEMFKILNAIISELHISILFTTSMIDDIVDLDNIIVVTDNKIVLNGSFKEIILQDNELTKYGFKIPIMIDLSRKLQFYNLIEDIYYDVDKVVDTLWK